MLSASLDTSMTADSIWSHCRFRAKDSSRLAGSVKAGQDEVQIGDVRLPVRKLVGEP
jgi:hypothetical protein